MKSEKHNRQAQRTRRALSDALIALILEKRYDAITVQDIIERADVGRSTFYAHFRDKEDLLFGEVERLLDALARHGVSADQRAEALFPSLGLLRHVQERQDLYQALVRGRGADLFFEQGRKVICAHIEQRLAALPQGRQATAIPPAVVSLYLTGAFTMLLKWWLDGKMPCSPERVDEMYWQMAAPAVAAALGLPAVSAEEGSAGHDSATDGEAG